DEDREEDLVPKVGDSEHVAQAREPGHGADDLLSTRVCECTYRLVSAFPRAGGRRSPHGGGITCVVPPAPSIARTAAAEKPCARTVSDFVSSPRASTFTRPRLATRPCARSDSGVTSVPASNVSSVERLTTWYSTRNGFVKPLAFGVRRCSGVCPPSKR